MQKLVVDLEKINTQHCLLVMIKEWKEVIDKAFGVLFTDSSKDFDYDILGVLIANLHS